MDGEKKRCGRNLERSNLPGCANEADKARLWCGSIFVMSSRSRETLGQEKKIMSGIEMGVFVLFPGFLGKGARWVGLATGTDIGIKMEHTARTEAEAFLAVGGQFLSQDSFC